VQRELHGRHSGFGVRDRLLRQHPSAGHDLSLDDPSWIVDQILAWQLALSQ
jgi:hypothetical protein